MWCGSFHSIPCVPTQISCTALNFTRSRLLASFVVVVFAVVYLYLIYYYSPDRPFVIGPYIYVRCCFISIFFLLHFGQRILTWRALTFLFASRYICQQTIVHCCIGRPTTDDRPTDQPTERCTFQLHRSIRRQAPEWNRLQMIMAEQIKKLTMMLMLLWYDGQRKCGIPHRQLVLQRPSSFSSTQRTERIHIL